MSIIKNYKWYFIISALLIASFVLAALWLYYETDAPQLGPFQYQVF